MLPSSLPLYDGDIMKLVVADDQRIVAAQMPAVNRVSASLKGLASMIEDTLTAQGIELVQAGIGDCNAGYTMKEFLMAILAIAKMNGDSEAVAATERLIATVDGEWTVDVPYGDVRGVPSLFSGIKPFLDALLGVEVRDYVTITHGGRAAVFLAIKALLPFMLTMLRERSIDGMPLVAVPVPTWGTYPNIIEQALGSGCFFPIQCEGGLLDAEALDKACSSNPCIRMLIFCNPVNPTGLTYGSDRMARIARMVAKHQLCVHDDDMYAMFGWARPHRSLLRAAAAMAHTTEDRDVGIWVASHSTMLTGVMKAGGSGTRVNFMVIPNAALRARFVAAQGDLYGPPNLAGQMLQLAFLQNKGPERVWLQLRERRNALQQVLERVRDAFAETPIQLTWTPMEGGFYTAACFRGVEDMQFTDNAGTVRSITTGEDFVICLLELAGVIGSPDSAACIKDPCFVRLAYGTMSVPIIEQMGDNLIKGLNKLLAENGHPAGKVING